MKPFQTTIGGARLAGEEAGMGECVVMLHAGVADRRMWRDTMLALSPNHRTVSYDRRGFGETATPDEDFSHVDDLAAVLDWLDCARATLVGCSQGGRVAIDFALARPERVGRLILVASAVTGAAPPASYPPDVAVLLAELDDAESRGDLDRVNAIEAHLWLDGPTSREGRVEGAKRALFLDMNGKALRHPPLTQERAALSALDGLGEIVAPTLVIVGDLDFPHLRARAREIAATIPRAKAVAMAGCAHLPSLESPEAFNQIVAGFLGP